jgi:hypothetical protein
VLLEAASLAKIVASMPVADANVVSESGVVGG